MSAVSNFLIAGVGLQAGAFLLADGLSSGITDTAGQATTESTLKSLVIPAYLVNTSNGIEVEVLYSCTNSAAIKTIRGRFGGNVLWNLNLSTHLTEPFRFRLRNRGSYSSQIATPNSPTIYGQIGSVGVQTFTVDFTADQALTLTGQFGATGTGTNSVAIEEVTIRLI